MEIRLKECNDLDIDLVLTLSRETYFESFSAMNTVENMEKYLATAFNGKKITADLRNPNVIYFILLFQNKPVGYLRLNEKGAQTEFGDELGLEIERVYIIKEYQGRGLGKVLINKGIEVALEKGKEYVWLGVWEKNDGAARLYEQMGFEKFDTHDFYMGDEKQKDYLMKRRLG